MEEFFIRYGLLGVIFAIFLDDIGFPFFPATTLLFTSAVFIGANPDAVSIWALYFVGLVIPPLGNAILFSWGQRGARKWLNTHGHKIFLPNKRLKKADKIFRKYGEKTVFIAAIFPTIRCVISVIAGASKMKPFKFYLYHFFGVIVWATVVAWTGYFLGDEIWRIIARDWQIGLEIILGVIVLWTLLNFLRKR